MSTPCLPRTLTRPRPFSVEALAALATASVIGAAWWMGSLGASRHHPPLACPGGDHVTSPQVEEAAARLREAERRARYAAMNGSPYAAAKVGLPAGAPERVLADEAAAEVRFARQDLVRLCAAEP